MTSGNPVSPKAVAAAVGAAIGPIVLEAVLALVNLVQSGSLAIPAPWDKVAYAVAAVAGALLAAYRVKDGLRLPTLDAPAVQALPNSDQLLATAVDKLNDPVT